MKTAGVAATAATETTTIGSPNSAATAIDLGEKGLSNGDIQWNEEYAEVNDAGITWDNLGDHIFDGHVGVVGNAVDTYGFSGTVTDIDIRGKAAVTSIRS